MYKRAISALSLILFAVFVSGSAFITQDKGTYGDTKEIMTDLERLEARAEGILERLDFHHHGENKDNIHSAQEELLKIKEEANQRIAVFYAKYDEREKNGLVATYISNWYRTRIKNRLSRIEQRCIIQEIGAENKPLSRIITSSPGLFGTDDGTCDNSGDNAGNYFKKGSNYGEYSQVEVGLGSGPKLPLLSGNMGKIPDYPEKKLTDGNKSGPIAVLMDNAWDQHPQLGLSKAQLVVEYPDGENTSIIACLMDYEGAAGPVLKADDKAKNIVAWTGGEFIQEMEKNPDKYSLEKSEQSTNNRLYYAKFKADSLKKAGNKRDFNNIFGTFSPEIRGDNLEWENGDKIQISYSGGPKISYLSNGAEYERFVNERAHVDACTKRKIAFNTLLLVAVGEDYDKTGSFTGFGTALLFKNEKVLEGVWLKEKEESPLKIYNRLGEPVNPGDSSVMIELIRNKDRATYFNGINVASL